MVQLSPFTIRVRDFNLIFKNKIIMSKLRELTLQPDSGLNNELNDLTTLALTRRVEAKIILGYYDGNLISWALCSKEPSSWYSTHWGRRNGALFEVFVLPEHRQQGVGKAIFEMAKAYASPEELDICPWDDISQSFYDKVNKEE